MKENNNIKEGDLTSTQKRVLHALYNSGPSPDVKLVESSELSGLSESCVRSRRAELVKLGFIELQGSTELYNNGAMRKHKVWRVRRKPYVKLPV